jgi:hypothetical protein
MKRKRFDYWDLKIFNPKLARVFYLRHKLNRQTAEVTISVRTHRDGKGALKVKPIQAVVLGESTYTSLWKKINKKFPFQFVRLENIPGVENE